MGRAKQDGTFDSSSRRPSRIPKLRIAFGDDGESIGDYEVTYAIGEAIDNFHIASAGDTRVFTPYGREVDAALFAWQLSALLEKAVENFTVGSAEDTDVVTCEFSSAAGVATALLARTSARRIATALANGEALIFEGANGEALVDLQALLSVSLGGALPLPMTISDGDFSAEVTPSANAFAFFPVDYQADDARLRGSSLLGGRALALDTHVDRAFLTSSDEVQKHTIVDGGISASAYNSYLLAVEREELEKSRLKALVAMQGRIAAFADNASSDSLGEDLRGLASIVESFLFSEALALDLALVAERVRLSSYAEHSRLVSVVSAEEIGVLATEVAFQAALGNQGAISNFLRGLDHLVSAQITGVAREFALIEAVGLDVVTHLNEIFSAINHAFYGDSS